MSAIVKIYTENLKELSSFLESFYSEKINLKNNSFYWKKIYENPIEIADISAVFVDNKNKFPNCNMWVSVDKGVFINITDDNYNSFIKYLFERYPY